MIHSTTTQIHTNRNAGTTLWAMLCCVLLPGCYDSQALIADARAEITHSIEKEVDLGSYFVTMPRVEGESTTVAIRLQVYANVANRDLDTVQEQYEEVKPSLRSATIKAIRHADVKELAEPRLTTLRGRISNVTQGILHEAPIKSIDFNDYVVLEE